MSQPCGICYTCQVCVTCEKYGCQVGEATVPPQQQWIPQQQQWIPVQPIMPQPRPPMYQQQALDEKRIREIVIEVLIELGLISVKGRKNSG